MYKAIPIPFADSLEFSCSKKIAPERCQLTAFYEFQIDMCVGPSEWIIASSAPHNALKIQFSGNQNNSIALFHIKMFQLL